jgi:gamma-glutamyltranspeptidase
VLEQDTAKLVLGGAGSRRTTSAILHTISGVLDRRLTLAEAVDAPRFHVKLSRKAWLERASTTESLSPQLAQRFRHIRFRSRYSYAMGCVQAIAFLPCGSIQGRSDPRREGTAKTI